LRAAVEARLGPPEILSSFRFWTGRLGVDDAGFEDDAFAFDIPGVNFLGHVSGICVWHSSRCEAESSDAFGLGDVDEEHCLDFALAAIISCFSMHN
jgi:hypothetical protein